ncbi:MAG: HAD family hydrolase [Patescibacteria group bacterium]|nr:HAD family hydrolase [Patescibacteria group bacterium]
MIVDNIKKAIAQIEKIDITNNEFKYAVFDFDNTCVVNDVAEAAFAYLCENNLLKDFSLLGKKHLDSSDYHAAALRHYYQLLDQGKTEQAFGFIGECLSGFSLAEVAAAVKKTVASEGEAVTKRILFSLTINRGLKVREGIKELLAYAHKKNIAVWVISASPESMVKPAWELFFPNVKAECIGIENVMNGDLLTAKLIYPLPIAGGKVANIQNKIQREIKPIFAIGDSINDQPMLEYAELAIVIDRGNSLAEYAKGRKDWVILAATT